VGLEGLAAAPWKRDNPPMKVHHRDRSLVGVLVAFGCLHAMPGVARTFVTAYAPASHPTVASARDLPVFMANEVAPRPVRVLATLRMETADLPNLTTSTTEELVVWKNELRKTAFRLGADAVTGVYEVRRTDSAHITVCALAVAYRDSADGADTCGCVVALPLPRLRLGVPEEARKDIVRALQVAAALELVQKGYYAFLTSDSLASEMWPAQAARFSASGRRAEDVFDFTLAQAGPDPADMAAGAGRGIMAPEPIHPATARILAALVSTRGDTLWRTAVSRPTNPLVDVYFSGPFEEVEMKPLYRYLHDALAGMPGPPGRREDVKRGK
jgi:hypothetical protein